jgi:apolipoprotein N-acyltransferase
MTTRPGSLRCGLALSAAGAAFIALCWVPTGLAPLLPVGFLLLLRGARHARSYRDAVLLGVTYGAAEYAVAANFMLALLRYSWLAIVYWLLTILFIIPFAIVVVAGALWLERNARLPRSLGFAVLWVAMEKLRTMGELSFPADLFAHAFGTAPSFLALAPVVGPFGVVFVVLLAAAALDAAVEHARDPRRRLAFLAAGLALWLLPPAAALPGTGRSTERPAAAAPAVAAGAPHAPGIVRVGIVQPSVGPLEKKNRIGWPVIWDRLRSFSRDAARGADLVLWPESARPGFATLRNGSIEDREVAAIAREIGVPILYGTVIAEFDGDSTLASALYNGAVLMRPDGACGGWYGKQRLLPFVEGVPFGKFIGLGPRKRARGGAQTGTLGLLGNFTAGPQPTIFEVGDARIAVLICYEGQYPQLGRAASLAGANMLAVLTNDMWWGDSVFPPWHARMVAARARELRMPVVRAANNGISSLTDAEGRFGPRTRLGPPATLTVDVPIAQRPPTFYARNGDLSIPLLLAGVAVYGVLARRR